MIIPRNDLFGLRSQVGEETTVALRLGCYDLLHAGHQASIDYAASLADVLVIGVMPDVYVTKTKGPDRPFNSESDRVAKIDSAQGVNYSFIAPADSVGIIRTMITLQPDVYVEGKEHYRRAKATLLRLLGVEYATDEQDATASSSLMIAHLGLQGAMMASSLNYIMPEKWK